MSLYIGVDGGGTKTEAAFLDSDKEYAISLVGPASNPQTAGLNRACSVVTDLVSKGILELNSSVNRVTGLSIGMAGVDSPEEAENVRTEIAKQLQIANFEVVNDSFPALTAGTMGGSGVALIAGTGSIAVGEDELGRTARSGGYGNLIGDEGSGFDIGRMGIMAAIQGFEGRGPETKIWPLAMEFFKVDHAQRLIPTIYGARNPVGTIASFAGQVISLTGIDGEADRIIQHAVDSYQKMIDSVYGQLEDLPQSRHGAVKRSVVLAGGVFLHNEILVNQLKNQLSGRTFSTLKQKAAFGAVLRAMKQANGRLSKADVALWKRSISSLTVDSMN